MLRISSVDAAIIAKVKRGLVASVIAAVGFYSLFMAAQLNGFPAISSALLVPLVLSAIAVVACLLLYLACMVVVFVSGGSGA